MVVNPLYYQEKRTMMCIVVEGARVEDGQAECFED